MLDTTDVTVLPEASSSLPRDPATGVDTEASTPLQGAAVRPRPLDLSTALLDVSEASTSARGAASESFIVNFRQVALEGTKARGRYLATRRQLDRVKQRPEHDDRFAEDMEDAKAQVSALLDDLEVECRSLLEVETETMEISREVADLVDNDERMSALIAKMNRKLDVFQATIGNF